MIRTRFRTSTTIVSLMLGVIFVPLTYQPQHLLESVLFGLCMAIVFRIVFATMESVN